MDKAKHKVSLGYFLPKEKTEGWFNRFAIWLADRVLGVNGLDKIYQKCTDSSSSKEEFLAAAIDTFGMEIKGGEELIERIPASGPVVIAANHPFGGLEGIALPSLIVQKRPDIKVLVNHALKVLKDLDDFFIYVDPVFPKNPKNLKALKECIRHVDAGGALLIFPGGKVSYFRKDKNRVSEHVWNKIIGRLVKGAGVSFLPLFIEGRNSSLFYTLGRIYHRFRLLMLPRELLNKKGRTLELSIGHFVKSNAFSKNISDDARSQLCRAISYAQSKDWKKPWEETKAADMQKIAEPVAKEAITEELASLPAAQTLLDTKGFCAVYASKKQIPYIFREIARLREQTYREYEEGSGQPEDSDVYDDTYTHLVLYDRNQNQIAGSYRFGQTDIIVEKQGIEGLYLHRMFDFDERFIDPKVPSLEMGRSFLTKEYQRSIHGLHFLWKAIGEYLVRFPRYRKLYGTVSISKIYDSRSVSIIREAFISQPTIVKPRIAFDGVLHPEIKDFAADTPLKDHLKPLLQSIEKEQKDIPVLLKHYLSLGAEFFACAVDEHFNMTPGLMLSVDIPKIPAEKAERYFGENWKNYVEFGSKS